MKNRNLIRTRNKIILVALSIIFIDSHFVKAEDLGNKIISEWGICEILDSSENYFPYDYKYFSGTGWFIKCEENASILFVMNLFNQKISDVGLNNASFKIIKSDGSIYPVEIISHSNSGKKDSLTIKSENNATVFLETKFLDNDVDDVEKVLIELSNGDKVYYVHSGSRGIKTPLVDAVLEFKKRINEKN